MISQKYFSEQGLHAQASSASPNNTDTSTQFSTGFPFRERTRVSSETRASRTGSTMAHTGFIRDTGFSHRLNNGAHRFYQKQTQSPRSLDQGVHAFLSTTQANGFRDKPGYSAEVVPSTHRGSGSNGGRSPPTVQLKVYICMHQG